jgi:hypothetical protein
LAAVNQNILLITGVEMKSFLVALTIIMFALCAISCQPQQKPLTEAQLAAIADSAKAVVQSMLARADELDFKGYFDGYATDTDVRCVENGSLHPSLDFMKKAYADLQPAFESLHNTADSWEITVLSSDAVVITMPKHFTFKPKGLPEFKAQSVWSGVLQHRGGKWKIIQSHESWLNPEQIMAAFVPPPTKQSHPKK